MSRCALALIILLASATSASPQNWPKDADAVRAAEREKRWDDVLRQTAAMLPVYRDDAQVKSLYDWRATALESAQRWDAIVAEAESLGENGSRTPDAVKGPGPIFSPNNPLLAQVLTDYAGRLHRQKQGGLAIRVYRLVLARCPAQAERCASARLGIGDCCIWHIKDAQPSAVAEYVAVVRDYPAQKPAVATALQRLADYGSAMKDPRACADACASALTRYKDQFDADTLERFAIKRGEYLQQLEPWDAAVRAYREAEENFAVKSGMRGELAWRQAAILQEHGAPDAALTAYQRVLASHGVDNPGRCVDSLRRIVDLHLAAKRFDEAAKAAHVGLDTGDRDWMLPKMVECLKGLDPSNAKLTSFLLREADGAEHVDATLRSGEAPSLRSTSVLAEIGYPAWPAEIEQAFEKSQGDLGGDWRSLWRKGRLCLYRGRPREAAPLLYRAWLTCPNVQEALKLRRDLIEDVYHGLNGTHVGSDRWRKRLCPPPDAPAVDDETAAALRHDRPANEAAPEVRDARIALEVCLEAPYPLGANPQNVTREREVFLDAYARIAIEKGREDDLLRFCRKELEKERLAGMYDNFVQTGAMMCRSRDGHSAGELRFLEELAACPDVAARAKQIAQNLLNQMKLLRNPVQHQPQLYRKFLPPKKK